MGSILGSPILGNYHFYHRRTLKDLFKTVLIIGLRRRQVRPRRQKTTCGKDPRYWIDVGDPFILIWGMGFSLFMRKGSFLLPSPRVMWAKVRGRYVLGLGFRLRAIFLHLSSLFLTQASRQAGCFKFQSPRLEGWVGHKLFKLSYNVEHGSRPERYSDLI